MEKMVIIKMSVTQVKLTIVNYAKNGFFAIDQEITENIKLGQDMKRDGYLKPLRISETINILKVFRQIIDNNNITNILCFADLDIGKARNQIAFFDEIYKTVSLYFKLLNDEEQISILHNAVIHSFSIPKGVIVYVDDNSTQLIHFNRRAILNSAILDFGSQNLAEMFEEEANVENKMSKMTAFTQKEIEKLDWIKDIEEDFEYIGIGEIFLSIGRLARKSTHYPLEVAHNYALSLKNFISIYNLIKSLEVDSTKRLKGIGEQSINVLAGGICIIKALTNSFISQDIHISNCGFNYGVICKTLFAQTTEKPLLDILGYSLSAINEFYPTGSNVSFVYNLAIILFRELKVIHKLGRQYVKILRIAASMSSAGKRISFENYEKNSFHVICNSNIYGATHKEIVMAAFVASCQNIDDFSMSEWVRYKDILDDEDPDSVKKLAMIVKLSNMLDITNSNFVKDIYCDVLGDTVILKTEVEKDASLEISQAMKLDLEFKKVFKKNLQIL